MITVISGPVPFERRVTIDPAEAVVGSDTAVVAPVTEPAAAGEVESSVTWSSAPVGTPTPGAAASPARSMTGIWGGDILHGPGRGVTGRGEDGGRSLGRLGVTGCRDEEW